MWIMAMVRRFRLLTERKTADHPAVVTIDAAVADEPN
jgi:hypothetical protein